MVSGEFVFHLGTFTFKLLKQRGFQHMLAHNDSVTVGAGNMDVVLDGSTPQLKKLRQRCISGGRLVKLYDRVKKHLKVFCLSS